MDANPSLLPTPGDHVIGNAFAMHESIHTPARLVLYPSEERFASTSKASLNDEKHDPRPALIVSQHWYKNIKKGISFHKICTMTTFGASENLDATAHVFQHFNVPLYPRPASQEGGFVLRATVEDWEKGPGWVFAYPYRTYKPFLNQWMECSVPLQVEEDVMDSFITVCREKKEEWENRMKTHKNALRQNYHESKRRFYANQGNASNVQFASEAPSAATSSQNVNSASSSRPILGAGHPSSSAPNLMTASKSNGRHSSTTTLPTRLPGVSRPSPLQGQSGNDVRTSVSPKFRSFADALVGRTQQLPDDGDKSAEVGSPDPVPAEGVMNPGPLETWSKKLKRQWAKHMRGRGRGRGRGGPSS
ncbi:hypothetical protein FA95DRAFT_1575166 [Auriscalpium vulgare]|uniref:Uncharacterized protein n=1 Tax=Auriscalpium vulgare TaxID=40419 RepID=A0ACB8RHG4_9AGAM|nr:hypothetical protein FA95DRAFT_1575166 [Auriscalpium vulgare]